MGKQSPEYEIFKGYDMIRVFTGRTWTDKDGDEQAESITFGLRKAQAICEHIDEIRRFAERGDTQKPQEEDIPF